MVKITNISIAEINCWYKENQMSIKQLIGAKEDLTDVKLIQNFLFYKEDYFLENKSNCIQAIIITALKDI